MAAGSVKRRRYVLVACAIAFIAGLSLLGGRLMWRQYKFAQRDQIMATAPSAFDDGILWMVADNADAAETMKHRLVNSHPAYALGVAVTALPDGFDPIKKSLLCESSKVIITATMASCKFSNGSIRATGDYLLNFADHPMPPTKFTEAGIPLQTNGLVVQHYDSQPIGHYLGYTYESTRPNYAQDAQIILSLLTKKMLRDIPTNGTWTPANDENIDARNCYAVQGRNTITVTCFLEG